MRPNADPGHGERDSGRIIYLGDVRRRRAAKSRAPDRHYLAALLLIAGIAWLSWALVLLTVPPSRLLTYLAFFVPLWVAVSTSVMLAAYGIDRWRGHFPDLSIAGRRGVIAATILILNLASAAAHGWSVPIGAVTVLAGVGLDILIARRNG